MTQPFEVTEEGVFLNAATLDSQVLVSPAEFGVGLSEDVAKDSQEKADLLERRLRRIELALGIDATPESTAALQNALSRL